MPKWFLEREQALAASPKPDWPEMTNLALLWSDAAGWDAAMAERFAIRRNARALRRGRRESCPGQEKKLAERGHAQRFPRKVVERDDVHIVLRDACSLVHVDGCA